ncbi:MAG: hypothetical protein O3C40_18665 [Planctomycetota bacterium]|nr:hypothetical protein [Planctomycetota bacterium]
MSQMMHLFRKYQYMLLIVFGVLLMFVFVIGDALTNLMGGPGQGGGGQSDEVVLNWKHGAVSGSDLYSQGVRHRLAVEFLMAVVQETVRREGTPKGPGVFRDQFGRYSPGITVAETDEATVQKMLLAAKAESLGVKVDNDAVEAFLRQLSDGELDDNDIGVIYNKTIAGRMTQQHLMDQLQHELLAQQMLMMTRAGLFVVPPHQAWEFHNRMRRRVQTEMVALKVDDFKDKVSAMPTDAEIKTLYEEGKDRFPNPYSPEPAFKRRRKLAFEYVRADSGPLQEAEAAKIKDTITDEEIEKYYEENKVRYRVIDLPESEPASDSPKPATEAPAEGAEQPSEEAKPDKSPDAAPDKPADEPAKEEAPKDDAAPAPPTEKSEAPAKPAASESDPAPAADAPTDEQPTAASEEENCGDQEEETPAETTEPAATPEPPAPVESAPAAAADPAKPAIENPPAAPEATSVQPEKPAAPATDSAPASEPTEPAPEPPAKEAAEAPVAEEKPEEPKYKPLDDKLRAEIRDEIATDRSRQPAQERLTKSLDEIKAEIDAYGRQLRRIDVTKSGQKPAAVDFEKLATERGFVPGKIDPTDAVGIDAYDLGKAYEMTFTSWPPERVSFAQKAFLDTVQLYRAERIKSAEFGIEFLYWKVAEEEAFLPKLEDIRNEVVDAWKHREAFVFAKAEAEKLAKQAGAGKPLGESLSEHDGLEVIQPAPFSWMSTGSTPFGGAGAPTLSQVDGVEAAGNDFMKAVFSLKPGEVGVAVDQPQAMVYVVRIAAETPSEEILKEQFLASGVTPEMSQIAYSEIEDVWQDWYKDLEQEMNVKWKE